MHTLTLDLSELWAIRDWVRQHDRLGHEWDRDFERRLFVAMAEAKENVNRQASLTFESEEELWQITRQVPSGLMTGTQPTGRGLIEKAQAAILEWDDTGDVSEADEKRVSIVPSGVQRDLGEGFWQYVSEREVEP